MKTENKLVSVSVICYNNFQCLFDAIQSVLDQKYSPIELIVSDDGSSVFPKDRIEAYIREHAGSNIHRVIVRTLEKNQGTVKHLNRVLECFSGEYLHLLAADDVFADEHVIERYVQAYDRLGNQATVLFAQTAMYDETLTHLQYYYLRPHVREMLEKGVTGSELYKEIVRFPILPTTSTMFRRSFFNMFGKFDERYFLVEDVPTHLEMARRGIVAHYENFVAIKHRHGGISHGQGRTLKRSQILYLNDSNRIFEDELKQMRTLNLSKSDRILQARCKSLIFANQYMLAQSKIEKLKLYLKHPLTLMVRIGENRGSVSKVYEVSKLMLLLGMCFCIAATVAFQMLDVEPAIKGIYFMQILCLGKIYEISKKIHLPSGFYYLTAFILFLVLGGNPANKGLLLLQILYLTGVSLILGAAVIASLLYICRLLYKLQA